MNFRSSRSLRTALVASAAAGAMLLTACGGSDTAATSTSSSSSTSAAMSSAESPAASAGTGTEASGTGSAAESSAGTLTSAATATTAAPAELEAAKAGLVDSSKLKVCTSLPYAPFEYSDLDGKVVGFDMDMMDLVATELGVTREVVDTDFTGIQSGQAMGSSVCDIAAAAMTITPERQAAITFSDPYYAATQALLVPADSTITDLSGLSGKTLAAQAGTTGKIYGDANAAKYGYTVVEYTNITEVEAAVQTGTAQAGIHDDGPLFEYVKTNPAFKVATTFETGEQYGFGMKLGNTDLAAVVNAVIKKAVDDGTYDTVKAKWFPVG
ncbi:MAG: ABC transporter substrate-binding protein [Nakamurella sp.]